MKTYGNAMPGGPATLADLDLSTPASRGGRPEPPRPEPREPGVNPLVHLSENARRRHGETQRGKAIVKAMGLRTSAPITTWARANGHEVGLRTFPPLRVVVAYAAAHGHEVEDVAS